MATCLDECFFVGNTKITFPGNFDCVYVKSETVEFRFLETPDVPAASARVFFWRRLQIEHKNIFNKCERFRRNNRDEPWGLLLSDVPAQTAGERVANITSRTYVERETSVIVNA